MHLIQVSIWTDFLQTLQLSSEHTERQHSTPYGDDVGASFPTSSVTRETTRRTLQNSHTTSTRQRTHVHTPATNSYTSRTTSTRPAASPLLLGRDLAVQHGGGIADNKPLYISVGGVALLLVVIFLCILTLRYFCRSRRRDLYKIPARDENRVHQEHGALRRDEILVVLSTHDNGRAGLTCNQRSSPRDKDSIKPREIPNALRQAEFKDQTPLQDDQIAVFCSFLDSPPCYKVSTHRFLHQSDVTRVTFLLKG